MNRLIATVKTAANDFVEDDCMTSGASLAYYTIFSLPPLLVLVFLFVGTLGLSQERIDEVVSRQVGLPIAEQVSATEVEQAANVSAGDDERVSGSLAQIAHRGSSHLSPLQHLGPISKAIGALILIFSASGVFSQLQSALNRAWDVTPDPEQNGWKKFFVKRVLSFGMILVIAFLLLVSLVLTTLVDEFLDWAVDRNSEIIATTVAYVLNDVVSLGLATALFAMMYKILPDAKLRWKDIGAGAFITALLFVIGKTALGWYLQNSHIGSEWGSAAASMITLLVWVYYTSLIVLFGAELTHAWTAESGREVQPVRGAVRVVEETRRADGILV